MSPLRLRLRDFRNFAALDWSAPSRRLLLTGRNGAGKTSLLEALYLASTGRSFRAPRLESCARHGSASFSVRAEIGEQPRRELALGWESETGRTRTLDGKNAPLAEHLAVLPLLVWTQAESELLSGPPAVRRRFFDRGLVHLRPGLLESLGRYEAALREKRALLAAGGGARQLEAWNRLLGRHGAEIAAARGALVEELARGIERLRLEAVSDLRPVGLRYRPSPAAAREGEEALVAALDARRADERERRQPLVGPHRDEIEILWDGGEARRLASAGERKAVGLLLLAALARRLGEAGREPALLIDDADSELDPARLGRLMEAFAGAATLLASSSRPEAWPARTGLEKVAVEELSEAPRPVT